MALSKQLQYQALADLLAGLPVDLRPQDFTGIRRLCWEAVHPSPASSGDNAPQPDALLAAIFQATAHHPDRYEFLAEMDRVVPGAPWPPLLSLQEVSVDLSAVQWLWRGWLPHGFITLLGSVTGAGKSLVALDLCRRLLAGLPWPDGTLPPDSAVPPNLIYVEAESAAQILVERARFWQLDLARLFPFAPHGGDPIDLSFPQQREQLGELCTRLRPSLVVVDSLSAAYARGLTSVQQVRGLLDFLSGLAAEHDAALLLVHHLNKPGSRSGRRTLADFFGSFYIPAMSRSVISLTVESPQRRRLEVIKSNLSASPPPLAIELQPVAGQGVHLAWQPWVAPPPAAATPPVSPTLLHECQAWLLDLLERSGQPLRPAEIVRLGSQHGYSRRMIYRARRRLASAIVDTRGRQHPRNAWQKPPIVPK